MHPPRKGDRTRAEILKLAEETLHALHTGGLRKQHDKFPLRLVVIG
jgi:hypothetical protein